MFHPRFELGLWEPESHVISFTLMERNIDNPKND